MERSRRQAKAPIRYSQEFSRSQAIPARVLKLDISNVPVSDNKLLSKDFGFYTNPFWQNFYTPNDNITKEYIIATEKLRDILPANFQLIKNEPSAFGVANLEIKGEFYKPIKKYHY